MLSSDIVASYSAARRPASDRTVLCHAPFVNLNFDQLGRVTACCYNRKYLLGTYPENSLREIWTGPKARALRESFLGNRETTGCELCFLQLKSGNFAGTLMRSFDRFSEREGYRAHVSVESPLVLELEISNTCNLECVMCGGMWSSSIRAHRENLPPLRSPYDREFVVQLEEFLPKAAAVRFLGGEPFLIRRFYDVWESIVRLNPGIAVSITTNATFIPERARTLLEAMRADIVVSLDAVTRETYEHIRVKADFNVVMGHLDYLRDYTRRKNTGFSLAVCPMTHNWRELDRIVAFCEERQAQLHFNTVTRPAASSLAGLPEGELGDVIAHLRTWWLRDRSGLSERTALPVEGLITQLEQWRDEKRAFSEPCRSMESEARAFVRNHVVGEGVAELASSVEDLLGEFVRGYRIELEREGFDYFELGNLLARTSCPIKVDIASVNDDALLLAAQVFTRFLDSKGINPRWAEHRARAEHLALRRNLEWPLEAGGYAHSRVTELAQLIRAQLANDNVSAVVKQTRALLDALELAPRREPTPAQPLERPPLELVDRELSEQLATLRARGIGEEEVRHIGRYAWSIIVLSGEMAPSLRPADTAEDNPTGLAPPIESAEDLRLAIEALYVYHLCVSTPDTFAGFRRRIDHCLARYTTPQRAPAVARALNASGLKDAYTFLVRATDEELEEAARLVV